MVFHLRGSYRMHLTSSIIILLQLCSSIHVYAYKTKKVHLVYPVRHITVSDGNNPAYDGLATQNELTCLRNEEVGEPTYLRTLGCLLPFLPFIDCSSVWGSRTVFISSNGSIEFFKLSSPLLINSEEEYDLDSKINNDRSGNSTSHSMIVQHALSINATRWWHFEGESKDFKSVPAEPLYLCARANHWRQPAIVSFSIQIRHVYLRERDQQSCTRKLLIHTLIMIAASSTWLLPYLLASAITVFSFAHGLKYFLLVLGSCFLVVLFIPLMLTKTNRHLSRQYLGYFFTRIQAEETRVVIKQRLPVFQAVFFSSSLTCLGTGGAYFLYSYCGIDREHRNVLLKLSVAVSAGWLVFSLCRSFERFVKNWIWVLMAAALAQVLAEHLNPMCNIELVFSAIVVTLSLRFVVAKTKRNTILRGRAILELAGWGRLAPLLLRSSSHSFPSSLDRLVHTRESDAASIEALPNSSSSEHVQLHAVDANTGTSADQEKDFRLFSGHGRSSSSLDKEEGRDESEDDDEDDDDADEDDARDDDEAVSIDELFSFEPLVKAKSAEGSFPTSHVSVPLWRQLMSECDGVLEGSSAEALNRSALSNHVGIDLSSLFSSQDLTKKSSHYLASSSSSLMTSENDSCIGTVISATIHVAGPLSLNGVPIWIPFPVSSQVSRDIFEAISLGCTLLSSSSIRINRFGSRVIKKAVIFESPDFSTAASLETWFNYQKNMNILHEIARSSLNEEGSLPNLHDKIKIVAAVEGNRIVVTLFFSMGQKKILPNSGNSAIESIAIALFEQFSTLKLKKMDSFSSGGGENYIGVDACIEYAALDAYRITQEKMFFFHDLESSECENSTVRDEVLRGLFLMSTALGIDFIPNFSKGLFQSITMKEVEDFGGFRLSVLLSHLNISISPETCSIGQISCMKLLGFDVGPSFATSYESVAKLEEVLAGVAMVLYLGSLVKLTESKLPTLDSLVYPAGSVLYV